MRGRGPGDGMRRSQGCVAQGGFIVGGCDYDGGRGGNRILARATPMLSRPDGQEGRAVLAPADPSTTRHGPSPRHHTPKKRPRAVSPLLRTAITGGSTSTKRSRPANQCRYVRKRTARGALTRPRCVAARDSGCRFGTDDWREVVSAVVHVDLAAVCLRAGLPA